MSTTDLADALREGFSGQVLEPGQPGYDESRLLFNPTIDRRPAVVARCATTADVVAAVNTARDGGLVVAVRCGGHSFSGLSTCDGGMQIDLRGLKSITVDPATRTARAGGGVLWGEFDAATQEHGLHTPGGRVTTTGLGGFTTRGGGGNFGIVTEFEFRLHPLGPIVLAGLMMFPIDRAPDVLRRWRDWSDAAPDEVATGCAVVTAPPEPFVPPELHGKPVLGLIALYVGDPEAGAAAVQPIKDLGPAVDHLGPMPYTAFQAALDPLSPYGGGRFYARGEYLPGLSDGAIDAFLAHAPGLLARSHPFSQMVIFRTGQGVAAVPDGATAFSHRDANYLFHPITVWTDPANDEQMTAAARAYAAAMRPFSTGAAYLNFTHEADRVRDAYGDAKYARLVALKDTYDPANLFRLNKNIRPSHTAAEPALA